VSLCFYGAARCRVAVCVRCARWFCGGVALAAALPCVSIAFRQALETAAGRRPCMHRTLGLLRVCAMPRPGRRPSGGVGHEARGLFQGFRADFTASDRFHGPSVNVYRRFHRHAGRRRCQLRLRMRFLRGLLLEQGSREQRKPSTRTVSTLGATGGRAAAPPRPRPGGARRSSSSDAWGHRSHRGHGGLGPARSGAPSHFPR
jgi:hypothetical protein